MALQIGIDAGARAVKVIAGKSKGPLFEVQRAISIPVATGDDPAVAVLDAIAELQSELGKAPGARYGVSGKDLIIRYTKVPPVPLWRLRLLMDFEVREMAEQAGEPLACDYNLVGTPAEDGEETVLVAVVKEHSLENRHDAITQAVGEPKSGMPCSLALFNSYINSGELFDEEYVFLVDIGDRSVEIVLQKDGELLFARNIATGGGVLTDAVAQTFGVSKDDAESIKEEYGNVTPKGMAAYASGKEEKVANALIGPVGQLASMIQSSLAFARAQTGIRDLKAGRILLSGGGANLRGLPEYLQSSFDCPVQRFQPESGLDLSPAPADEAAEFERDPGRFAVALGLAVAGAKEDAFLIDLMPAATKKKREFSQRTLWTWLAAAAAILVLALHWMNLKSTAESTRKEARVAQTKAKSATRKRREFTELQKRINLRNDQLNELDYLTRRNYSVATALRLFQDHAPNNIWVEDMNLVDKAVPIDGEDLSKGKVKKTLVTIEGIILQMESQANTVIAGLSRAMEKSRPMTSVTLTGVSANRSAVGSKQTRFALDIDLFADDKPAKTPETSDN